MMKLRYLVLFVSIFSLFFFPTLLYAQSSTPWSFYNNPGASNAMDIFYNGVGAANPAVRIKTGGNVGIGTTTPNARLSFVNNVGTGFLDSYGEYQILLWDGGAAASAYGLGIKSNTMVFNSGAGAYSFDRAGAATTMTLETNGNVGIGTSAPGYKLDVNGSANISGNLTLSGTFSPTNLAVSGTLTAANGGFNLNNSGTSRFNEIKAKMWSAGTTSVCYGINEAVGSVTISTIGGCSSDRRLKKNIRYFEGSFLSRVNQLKPALFDLKDNSKKDVAGFIAQDVQEVFPETVYDKGADQMLEFSPNNLIPHLTKAIQELSQKVDQQQAEIEQLKKQLK
jgi:hypothetical protein